MSSAAVKPGASSLQCYALRLTPGQEVYTELLEYKHNHHLQAPFIMTCCGSLTRATLRLAAATSQQDRPDNMIRDYEGPFEIVSLVGTLSGDKGHLHISLSDKEGNVIGGHVIGGLVVFTTAEIVLGECQQLLFDRELDTATGFDELFVKHRI